MSMAVFSFQLYWIQLNMGPYADTGIYIIILYLIKYHSCPLPTFNGTVNLFGSAEKAKDGEGEK